MGRRLRFHGAPLAATPVSFAVPMPAVGAALPVCGPQEVAIRSGDHPAYGRIVFEWRFPVTYAVESSAEGATLRFLDAPCRPAIERLRLPRNVQAVRWVDGALEIETALQVQLLHHFRMQNRVVVDLLDP